MPGYRRSRAPAGTPTRREQTYRRRRNALNADFAAEHDPLARFDRAYRYARSALASARDRGYPVRSGPGRTAVVAATRALVGLGDQLLKPGHGSR